ncbi:MAG: hypothetical protein ABSG72_02810 [Candidatus Sulfotelmatobacter sp.]
MKALGAVLLMCVMMLTACGGGSDPTKQTADLSGNWQMTLQSTTFGSTEMQSGFLLQSGNTVTGSLLLSGQTVSGLTSCAGVGSALGQMAGSNLALTESPAGQTVNLTGTPANNFTSMSGDYSILAAGCGQTDVGTWTANQVDTLNGSFQATFSSNVTGGLVFQFTGTIAQGPNTGASTATLSGTMTSTNSPCFQTASIAGAISGTSLVFNVLNPQGEALGKYSGTVTTDASSITGGYTFSNAADTSLLAGCGGGDQGNATFTVQSSTAN